MAVKPLHDGYQKIPIDDKDFFAQSDEETDCNSGWGSERRRSGWLMQRMELLTPAEKKSCFFLVETWWFHLIAATVIGSNTVTIVLEADSEVMTKKFYWFEQGFLCFYVMELICRACLWKSKFLCGPWRLVMWSLLDLLIVSAGVVEWDLSWTDRPAFQSFIGGVIAVNALLMGCETDIDWGGWLVIDAWRYENVLLCIYVFELVVRLKRLGRDFFSCESPDLDTELKDAED
eukprot:Skav231172  [mRNA]  locus=scaffold3252:323366:332022:- [translate_table: standard]